MSRQFLLPDLGEGLTEAEIVAWLVAPGDVIVVDQPVVEVESAKSSVELPSPYGGRVESLHAAQGDVVHKGGILITVAETSDAEPSSPDIVPGTALRSEPASDSGSGAVLIGYGTKESTMRLARPDGGRFGGRKSGSVATAPTPAAPMLLDPNRHSPVISPLVRRRALDNGIDATQLAGSGPGSLVLREDVDAAIAGKSGSPIVSVPASAQTGDQRIPLTAMRKIIGQRLSHSRSTIPEATIWLDVNATELVAAKDRLQKSTGERFSLTALIARFAVAGLGKYPILNSSIDEAANEIVQHGSIGLGLAAQTSRGLMVPVVHGAESMTTVQLRDAIAGLVSHAEKGDYPQSALTGGTFTVNNYGGFGVDGSTPIINSPEVAMLGIGRMMDRPWVVDGQLAVRKVVTLSFVFDHRVCDGDVASGFITFVAKCIEEPLVLLGSV
ncbi:MAG TPA: dihydrolipoamide acetyltransferase family protein [Galbitalea sp.]|nr:dihydrolipoamide acetyltransferase family protein [Galbitalea sp.]